LFATSTYLARVPCAAMALFASDAADAAAMLFVIAVLLFAFRARPAARSARRAAFLSGRHVWVTGGSQGLGLSIARLAAECGARVTITSRSAPSLEAAAVSLGSGVRAVAADVSLPGDGGEGLRVAFARVEAGHGPIDVVIANAGVNHGGRPFVLLSDDDIERVVATNLLGTAWTFARCLPSMRERGTGVLCAVSSLAAYRGVPGASVYGGSKAGVTSLCQSLACELVGSGVRVCCVHPGFVETPAIADLDHAKPLLMTADAAAATVLDAVVTGRQHSGFPFLMEHVVLRFARAVPSPLYEWLLHMTGQHHAQYAAADPDADANKLD
jgi:NAD(P)-dependent dehydrogenase (short-subunit alcohol dehydrogenase family)